MPVSGDLVATLAVSMGFESACARFFRLHLPGTIVNVNCNIVKQYLVSAGRRSLEHMRILQNAMALDSTVAVSGIAITKEFTQMYFDEVVAPIVNDHPDDFISSLQMWGDVTNSHFYFVDVETVEAYDPDGEIPAVSPSAPQTPAGADAAASIDDGGLSTGALVSIVFGSIVSFGAIVAACVYFRRPHETLRDFPLSDEEP